MLDKTIEILLDKPQKLERLVLLFLKSLITFWGLNLIIENFYPLFFCNFINSDNLLNLSFIKIISPLKVAYYIVFIILFWILLWEIFTNWILPNICKLFVWILQFLLFDLIASLVLKIYIHLKKNRNNSEDIKMHKIDNSQFFKNLYDQNKAKPFVGSLYLFHVLNKITNSYIGSEALYKIIEHEKTDFIKGRILSYYTIILILFISIGILKPSWINWVYYFLTITFAYLAILIAAMKDVLQDISSNNLIDLKQHLRNHIYIEMVDSTFKQHSISEYFKCDSLRKRFVMTRKSLNYEKYCDYPRKKINVIRFRSEEHIVSKEFLEKFVKDLSANTKLIFVTNIVPDNKATNFIKENELIYILVENDKELYSALNKVKKTLIDWTKIEKIEFSK